MNDHLFRDIIKEVIQREGGATITEDPSDPGGLTKYGISKRSNPSLDIRNLSLEEAIEVYRKKYWLPSRAYDLKDDLIDPYFDMVVNSGQRRAVKILQQACNQKGMNLVVDGLIGKNTIKACKRLEPDRFRAFRVKYYADLVNRKPSLMKYYYGWFRRAISS